MDVHCGGMSWQRSLRNSILEVRLLEPSEEFEAGSNSTTVCKGKMELNDGICKIPTSDAVDRGLKVPDEWEDEFSRVNEGDATEKLFQFDRNDGRKEGRK